MDEMDPILPPGLASALNRFYAAQQPEAAFSSRLEAQLRQHQMELISSHREPYFSRSSIKGTFTRTIRTRPFLVLLLTILALLALTGMAYALGRLTGFIPGFGFTSDRQAVFLLAEPAEMTSGGMRLHVDQAVNDGERFWVEMTADGLSSLVEISRVSVLLPGGEKVQTHTWTGSDLNQGEMTFRVLFPSLNDQPPEVTLVVEYRSGQSFNLPLKLRPAEAGEIVPLPAEGSNQLQSETQDGLRLVLEHVAADHGKTVFQVSLRYDQPNTWIGAPWNVTLSDEDGALYPLTDVTPDTMTSGDIHVYQTVPFSGSEQLVLTLVTFPPSDSIPMFIDLSADSPSFDFDLGADAQVGQTWNLNQLLSYGDFNLKVIRATLDNGPRLVFEIEPGPSVTGAMFYTPDPLVTGSSGGVPVKSGNVTAGMTFSAIPQHPIEVRLMRIYCQKRGSWKIRWQPPAAPAAATNAPTQTVAPPLVHLPTPTLAISNPTLLEVQQLAKKFDSPFQQGPGWVHIVAESRTKLETITEPRAGQTFPPPYIKTEQWIEVDQDGYITRSVWLDYDDAGTMIQQTATVGNYSVNFTMGFSGFNEGTASRFSMDMLSRDLSGAIQRGSRLLREELTCEGGKSCLLISMFDNLEQSVTNPGETQAFSGSGRRVWIDLETGQQVKSQSFWLLEDGSEKITSTTSYLLVEKVDSAPQGILDVLKRVIVQ